MSKSKEELIAELIRDYQTDAKGPHGYFDYIPLDYLPAIVETVRDWALKENAESSQPDFEKIEGKRMSELTPAEQEDATELWLREQIGWMPEYHQKFYKLLLRRLDETRATLLASSYGAKK